jgi:4-hydroxy-tetrahydrodipicolinate reductase
VLGTTGLPDEIVTELDAAARSIPIVYAANYSVGVTVLAELCARAARALGRDWQAELIELHHRHKRDAPSGTALRLVEAIASARHQNAREVVRCERASRATPRTAEEIGVAALRGGDAVGEHTAMFLAEGERLELIHRANDRAIFARGAVRAASWVVSQPPGLYGMTHVLGMHEP